MDADHLSKRLLAVSQFVPQQARLADIGSDHAYLPAYLAIHQLIAYAVAGEVVAGPFKNEQTEIARLGIEKQVTARLANGLAAIKSTDKIDTIVIAGMGGPLIRQILEQGQRQLLGVQRLILQPNIGASVVRDWLMTHSYKIVAEQILKEDGHIYEIIVAEPTDQLIEYSKKELLFGPLLLLEHSVVFVEQWQREKERALAALTAMHQAKKLPTARIHALQQQVTLIEEVLQGES